MRTQPASTPVTKGWVPRDVTKIAEEQASAAVDRGELGTADSLRGPDRPPVEGQWVVARVCTSSVGTLIASSG